VIAYGVHASGRREVIGLDVGEAETEAFWRDLLRGLRARGLDGAAVHLDAHAGLKQAIAQVLGCRLAALNRPLPARHARPRQPVQQPLVSGAIRGIFTATSAARGTSSARLGRRLQAHTPKVAGLLEDAEAELLAFYAFLAEHWPKLRSTNPLERVNREIGRRSDVVGIFPND
jgi:transposase-like protein